MLMRKFIEEQPDCVSAALQTGFESRGLCPRGAEGSILFIGSGTSRHALMAAQPLFVGTRTDVVGPVTYLTGGHEADLVVILSQIGTSTTTLEAAKAAHASGARVLILTAEPQSPIARLGGATINIPASGETIGPKSKGYTASLAALVGLAAGADPTAAFDRPRFEAFVAEAENTAASLSETLDDVDFLLFAGDAEHYATALEASLKVAEIAGLPTAAFEIEEALHGRLHGLSTRSLAVLYVTEDARRDTAVHAARAMQERGVRVLLVNMTDRATEFDWLRLAGIDRVLGPIHAIVPAQWLAMQLAVRRGMSPDTMRFPGLSKALSIKVA